MSPFKSNPADVAPQLSGPEMVFSLQTGPTSVKSWITGGADQGSSGGPGNKSARAAVKGVIKEARSLNWRRQVSGSAAAAFWPDFFETMPKPGQIRDELWTTINETPYLHWFLVASHPDQITGKLPPYWNERPYRNVCLTIILGDAPDTNAGDIETLRETPSAMRGVWAKSGCDLSEIKSELSGIDYAIVPALTSSDTISQGNGPELIDQGHEACEADGLKIVRISSVETGVSALVDDFQNDFEPYVPYLANRKPRTVRAGKRSPRPTAKSALAEVASSCAIFAHDRHSGDAGASVVTTSDLKRPSPVEQQSTLMEVVTEKLDQFLLLDGVVRDGIRATVEAAWALKEIRDKELWREADYRNWNSYCESLVEFSRAYVNRLIFYATSVGELSADNPPLSEDGKPVLPAGESLSRPLKKLKDRGKRAKAWRTAVKRAGGMPKAEIVVTVVGEIMSAAKPAKPAAPSRKAQRIHLVNQLRKAVDSARSWDEVRDIVTQLEAFK